MIRMAAIEGQIIEIRKVPYSTTRGGIEIRVLIPEPFEPGIEDPTFHKTEEEYNQAARRNQYERKKYAVDMVNMYSLCLEAISIHPHRELEEVKE